MNFLQPTMLLAIPFIALPIIIHLINQRRYQTMRWGAMRFLLSANRMSKGYARIRQWLILACRMLAIAGLIFAASRPLASGLLGLMSGSRPDTTIVLLDRSPSMAQKGDGTTQSKLTAGIAQLVDTLETLGSNRWVVIESDHAVPQELESIDDLSTLPAAKPSSTSADVPKMLEAAANYVENNKTGSTEIWICSDLRANDWQRRSSNWQQLRDKFLAFPQSIRFHLFTYANPADQNLSIAVSEVERISAKSTEAGAELSVSLTVRRETSTAEPITIPIQFEIDGARSQTEIMLTGSSFELRGHRIPIDSSVEKGWGRVSIQADANTSDNDFYFAFDKPQPRRSVLVLEEADRSAPLEFAATVPPSGSVSCESEFVEPTQLNGVAWEDVSLVLWQAPLPEGDTAKLIDQYIDRGGHVVFFPPDSPNSDAFRGIGWDDWQESSNPIPVTTWRMDQDLLANTIGGSSLPVGELKTFRHCPPAAQKGDEPLTSLATLDGGIPLLSRLATPTGGVYFCSTTTDAKNSSLANNGVVLYVAVQRALANGASVLGNARQVIAGDAQNLLAVSSQKTWQQLSGSEDAISTEYGHQSGIYKNSAQLLAVNRDAVAEDHAAILPKEQIEGLFEGLNLSMMQNEVGSNSSLIQEIWRAFLVAMIVALLAEAILCVPRKVDVKEDKNSIFRERKERESVLEEMQGAA